MKEIQNETLNTLRGQFPKGTRVALVKMDDPFSTLKPGDKGTVDHVDDIGTIHVNWDRGSSLGIIYGEDICKKIKERKT